MILKNACLCLIMLLFQWEWLSAMPPAGRPVRKLSISQGLSNNSVSTIYQDRNGLMWFGTYDGLNSYDGYNFKIYRNRSSDSNSLQHDFINAIGEDLKGNLYIGTGQGIAVFNKLQSRFLPAYYLPVAGKIKKRISFNINAIAADKAGNVYAGTSGGGLLVKLKAAENFIQIPCAPDDRGSCSWQIEAVEVDGNQRIWIAAAKAGLLQYDPVHQNLRLMAAEDLNVRALKADRFGTVWVGAIEGLYCFNTISRSFNRFDGPGSGRISSKPVYSFSIVEHDRLWVGTQEDGVQILDLQTSRFTDAIRENPETGLSAKTVISLFIDRESRHWIGTYTGGLNIVEPEETAFETITMGLSTEGLNSNLMLSFNEDAAGRLWIGTDGGGLSIWNRRTNRFLNYRSTSGKANTLSHDAVPAILVDHAGATWLSTFGGGVDRFDPVRETFRRYRCINSQTKKENNYVWQLYEDSRHDLWATTYAEGRLYRFNREKDLFEMSPLDIYDLFCLLEDADGYLWGGNVYGLYRISKDRQSYTYFRTDKPIRAMHIDQQGRFWLGMQGQGILLFDRAEGKVIKRFDDTDGLCNNSVLNILGDDRGRLWLSTFHGLSRFDPETNKFTNFYQEDGLQSDQFQYNAAWRLSSGEMVFGGIRGFSIFHPDSLNIQKRMPPVYLSGISVNNKIITAGSPYVKSVSGDAFRELRVPYDDAVVSFIFAALEYSSPGKINYGYYLEGWDKTWNYPGNVRTATYTRLSEGNYTLHVRATDALGNWNPQEVLLHLTVLPPWYRSVWAYLCYAGISVLMFFLYNRYRVKKAALEAQVLLAELRNEKDKELALLEMREQKELASLQIRAEQELSEKKLAFFTDVSHEFRTPLTLIINPLKDYLQNSTSLSDKKELQVVYQNAKRLLTLADQLLEFRKAGTGTDQLRLTKLNFHQLSLEVWTSFENEAKQKRIHYKFFSRNENIPLVADREKMEVILYNLLSNALKFTRHEGEIILSLEEDNDAVELKLRDNGRGIPPEVGNKLFDRFYRVEDGTGPAKPGFGIGLFLVKHFVDKHKGSVSYESSQAAGTTFSLRFLKGKEHFADVEIQEEKAASMLQDEMIPLVSELPAGGLEELISTRKAILLVDDNAEVLNYLASIFHKDFMVYKAGTGKQGITSARKYLPDIIISDIMMEDGNGIELCQAVKNDPALGHIPVILLTAVSDNEIKLKGAESGADDYITKPFEKELLVARVYALLENRTKLQQYFFDEVTLRKHNSTISAEYKVFLDKCISIIEQHLHDDDFNIRKLSQKVGMSHSVLYKMVKSISGQTIAGFIRFIRLRKAADLMINTNENINEIAFQVGIKDIKYFRKQFNAQFGINPSGFVRKYRASVRLRLN